MIRRLVRIIDQVDVPPAQVVSEFIKLQRADATKVVEMLKEVFDKGGTTTPTTARQRPAGCAARAAAGPERPASRRQVQFEGDSSAFTALSEDSIVVGKIKIAADVRTNRIHVITRPVNMPFIRKLIAEFDANVEFGKPVTRPLRYISAADVLPVLVQALTEPGTDQAAGADAGSNPGRAAATGPAEPAADDRHHADSIPVQAAAAAAARISRKSFPPRRSIRRRKRLRSATPRSSPISAPTRSSSWAIAKSS